VRGSVEDGGVGDAVGAIGVGLEAHAANNAKSTRAEHHLATDVLVVAQTSRWLRPMRSARRSCRFSGVRGCSAARPRCLNPCERKRPNRPYELSAHSLPLGCASRRAYIILSMNHFSQRLTDFFLS